MPIDINSLLFSLFGTVGVLGVYIFKDFKKAIEDKLKEHDSRFKDLENASVGVLGVYIFKDLKQVIEDRLKEHDLRFKDLENASKELSRQEFEEVKSYVKESIDSVINSREFKNELKESIKECMLHFERNRSVGEAAMFEKFEDLLRATMQEIKQKIDAR